MAERRMISKNIVGSAKFIKLSLSAQALYFHLAVHADDDGIVEAFNVMRVIGANEGDFQALIDKQFIIMLNDDFVTYLPHWLDHNLIRDDRKINSIYQDLLLDKLPNVKVLIPRERADKKQKFRRIGTSSGRPVDEHRTAQVSIGEVSVVEISKGKNKDVVFKEKTKKEKPTFDMEQFSESVKETLNGFIQHRNDIKKPLTQNAWKLLCKKLQELSSKDSEQIEILETSIINGYTGIFPLKNKSGMGQEKKGSITNVKQSEPEREHVEFDPSKLYPERYKQLQDQKNGIANGPPALFTLRRAQNTACK